MRRYFSFRFFFFSFFFFVLCFTKEMSFAQHRQSERPNVLILYTDDLGYGDLSCYGAEAISTPHIDWLAKHGLKFTNAHCTAATCTPSRYSIISGRYAWRKQGTNILPGTANLIIDTNITTLPKVFQRAGYFTGAIGKWHLGLGDKEPIDWNRKIIPGPKQVGFDYSFIFPATLDRVPTVFLEDQKVVGLDTSDPIEVSYRHAFPDELTGKDHPELLKMKYDPRQGHDGHIVDGISRIGFMEGGTRAQWSDEAIGYTLNSKVIRFIDSSLKMHKPFFLYYAIHDIHVPRMPATVFKGKSDLGYRGDAILEMDHTVGYILQQLKLRHILDNTLIIFSSDNGPVLNDGYLDQAVETAQKENYHPAGVLRGGKYSVLEGGTRIPFMVYWHGRIKPHTISNAMVSQIDLMASFAVMLHEKLPPDEFTDSRDYFSTFIGKSDKSRNFIVEQPVGHGGLAIVKDGWKYITPRKGPALMQDVNIETGNSLEDQLYDLKDDIREEHNLSDKYPGKTAELKALLKKVEAESAP